MLRRSQFDFENQSIYEVYDIYFYLYMTIISVLVLMSWITFGIISYY
jgi:hypothetical protein